MRFRVFEVGFGVPRADVAVEFEDGAAAVPDVFWGAVAVVLVFPGDGAIFVIQDEGGFGEGVGVHVVGVNFWVGVDARDFDWLIICGHEFFPFFFCFIK